MSMLLLLLKNSQWDVCTGRRCSAKESVFGSLPNFCCPEMRSGLNRIGHPDWVKLCVELNCVPNQNTKFPSTTESIKFLKQKSTYVRCLQYKNYTRLPSVHPILALSILIQIMRKALSHVWEVHGPIRLVSFAWSCSLTKVVTPCL